MTTYTLENASLRLLVSSHGGCIEGFFLRRATGDFPLLRPGKNNGQAIHSSCFPFVPFASRVSGNQFVQAGKTYHLPPNTDWDPHYLHGDGWLNEWQLQQAVHDELQLAYQHRGECYCYDVLQTFSLHDDCLRLTLVVTHRGHTPLPYGLGWHPYFPMNHKTLLYAPADGYWVEREQWLSGAHRTVRPAALNFNQAAPIPSHWVNNGFSGWNGQAIIAWPDAACQLLLSTEPAAPCYFVFVSDTQFDPQYQSDYFCFEPMSHGPDDHHRPGAGKLKILEAGQTLQLRMRLQVVDLHA